MTFHYQWKNYPYAPKLTQKSKTIGVLTSGAFVISVGFLFIGPTVAGILETLGVDYDTGMWISVVSVIAIYFLLKNVRKKAFADLDAQYTEELKRWQETDSAKYNNAVQELQLLR